MKAIQVHVPGGPEALTLADLATPVPGPGEVRVKAAAIGVGRPDVLIRTGTYKWMPPLPAIPGGELAGVIDLIGDGVPAAHLGQRVLVSSRELKTRGGGYAEYICVPADAPYVLPDSIGFEDALSLPNFQLAHALLFGCSGGARARSVLIPGAAGGVAGAVIQLALSEGMSVIGTARSAEKRDFALAAGAQHVIMGGDESISARVMQITDGHGVDVALDHIGATSLIECIRSLAPLGTAVSYNIVGGMPAGDVFRELRALVGRSLAVRCFSMHTFDHDRSQRRALMQTVIELMRSRKVRAPVPTLMPLGEVRRAHEILDAGATMGKIVLMP